MNKGDFVAKVAEDLGESKSNVDKYLNSVLKNIVDVMRKDDELKFVGFGTFKARRTNATEVTTPQGQKVKVPASRRVGFSAGTEFKSAVNDE